MARTEAVLPVTFVIFDLLRNDGTDVMQRPYGERRALLESLDLEGCPAGATNETFDDARRCTRRYASAD